MHRNDFPYLDRLIRLTIKRKVSYGASYDSVSEDLSAELGVNVHCTELSALVRLMENHLKSDLSQIIRIRDNDIYWQCTCLYVNLSKNYLSATEALSSLW